MYFLTFLLPGLGQLLKGDSKKAGTIFTAAIVVGILSGGLGWFGCGLWSVMDLQTRVTPGPARAAAPGGSAAPSSPADAPAAAGGIHGIMPWAFKFTVLAVCAGLVLNNIRNGGVLQSLEFVGVKMQFASSLAKQSGETPPANDSEAAEPTLPDAASALTAAEEAPAAVLESPVTSAATSAAQVAGRWSSSLDSTFQIEQDGNQVQLVETSPVFYVPMTTTTCSGAISGSQIQANCTTLADTEGVLTLTLSRPGELTGIYLDHASGNRIPITLTR